MIKYEFKGLHNFDSVCGIERFGTTIICTEIPENNGTSITNYAEKLVAMICKEYSISFSDLLWIEHYPQRGSIEETYDLVTFDFIQGNVTNPKWKRISVNDVEMFKNHGLKKASV